MKIRLAETWGKGSIGRVCGGTVHRVLRMLNTQNPEWIQQFDGEPCWNYLGVVSASYRESHFEILPAG